MQFLSNGGNLNTGNNLRGEVVELTTAWSLLRQNEVFPQETYFSPASRKTLEEN